VKQVVTTRFGGPWGATPDGAVTTVNTWDTVNALQLQDTYLNGGANRHGKAITQYTSDGKLRILDVYHQEKGSILASPATVTIGYDVNGQPSSWITQYQDGSSGNSSISKSALDPDAGGRATLLTNEKGVQTTLAYDLYGRVTRSATQGAAAVTTTYPDPWTVVQAQAGLQTTTHLDGFGRMIKKDLPDGTYIKYTYDVHGRLGTTTKASTNNTMITSSNHYDLLGRPTSQTDFDGTTVSFSYLALPNGNNQVTRTVSGASPVIATITETDPFGQVVKVTAPNQDVTQTTYDGKGHPTLVTLTSATDQTSQSRSFTYDSLGRLITLVAPETGTQTFAEFNASNLAQTVTEGAQASVPRVRTRIFDGLGRLRSQTNGAITEAFTYTGPFLSGTSRTVNGDQVTQTFEYKGPGARLSQETTLSAVTGTW